MQIEPSAAMIRAGSPTGATSVAAVVLGALHASPLVANAPGRHAPEAEQFTARSPNCTSSCLTSVWIPTSSAATSSRVPCAEALRRRFVFDVVPKGSRRKRLPESASSRTVAGAPPKASFSLPGPLRTE